MKNLGFQTQKCLGISINKVSVNIILFYYLYLIDLHLLFIYLLSGGYDYGGYGGYSGYGDYGYGGYGGYNDYSYGSGNYGKDQAYDCLA